MLCGGGIALCDGEVKGNSKVATHQPHQANVASAAAKLPNSAGLPLAEYIDHTILKPNVTIEEVKRVCDEAIEFGFASVCVNSHFVGKVAQFLAGSKTKPISVIGFPLGAMSTASKAFEARDAISSGALEIDMVINIGALRGQDYETVIKDIQEVVMASRPYPVKVILETAFLSKDEIVVACVLSKAAGAAFVKTCTGFGGGGATVEDIRLMRSAVGPDLGVKASGGVRTLKETLAMIEAGATRIGTSSGVAIIQAHQAGGSVDTGGRVEGGGY